MARHLAIAILMSGCCAGKSGQAYLDCQARVDAALLATAVTSTVATGAAAGYLAAQPTYYYPPPVIYTAPVYYPRVPVCRTWTSTWGSTYTGCY